MLDQAIVGMVDECLPVQIEVAENDSAHQNKQQCIYDVERVFSPYFFHIIRVP